MTPDFYYLESDGQVYLVKDRGRWRFPKTRKELPCSFEAISVMLVAGRRVLFAKPNLQHHPERWFHKDDIPGLKNIDVIVQLAVNRSLPRGAAKVAIIEKGKVLMVRGARGLTKGIWNLPGGFIGYAEHPCESALREVREELGIRVKLGRLLGIYSETFKDSGSYMISFVYLGKRLAGKIRPHPEELESFKWLPVRQAARITKNPFARAALRDYLKYQKTNRKKTAL
jgi:ADP-ribose pyrophosphatase YjhB (NUDIX family)